MRRPLQRTQRLRQALSLVSQRRLPLVRIRHILCRERHFAVQLLLLRLTLVDLLPFKLPVGLALTGVTPLFIGAALSGLAKSNPPASIANSRTIAIVLIDTKRNPEFAAQAQQLNHFRTALYTPDHERRLNCLRLTGASVEPAKGRYRFSAPTGMLKLQYASAV